MRTLFALVLPTVFSPLVAGAAGVPQTDLVFFGAVFNQSGQQVTGALPSGTKIGLVADGLVSGVPATPTVLAETGALLDPGSGTAQFYVLRVRRHAGSSTEHSPADNFVLSQDRLRIYVDWNHNGIYEAAEQVVETQAASVLVTGAQHEVRFLSLNNPGADQDGDGLPDEWEMQFLGGTGQGPDDDANGDRVNNFLAWAMGLNPNLNSNSKLPFLERQQDGRLMLFFRLSSAAAGVTYDIESSDSLEAATWQPVTNASVEEVAVNGTSRILKATIAEGVDRPARFFRINWR